MSKLIAIIGGGPAGLMAAEQLLGHGFDVHLFDAMPSLGRKFLMAGKSGMNLSHNENIETFLTRYQDAPDFFTDIIRNFPASSIRDWATGLGVETFVGSSGRIFPCDFKAAPLLRSWLRRLRSNHLHIHVRHRWLGWQNDTLLFDTPHGQKTFQADATILALGSICWPKLGSNGFWQPFLQEQGISLSPFKPSNCGFLVDWSSHLIETNAGQPIKPVSLSLNEKRIKGEFVLTTYGVEGSAIYTLSRALRETIEKEGRATLWLDLCPDKDETDLRQALEKPRGSKSLSTHIKRTTGLNGVKMALLRECLDKDSFTDMPRLAHGIKNLPLTLTSPRPIEEAISCAGGVTFDQLNENLMVKHKPGLFLAGEMLNWDAPTGGYLLTACFALGRHAGLGCKDYLS